METLDTIANPLAKATLVGPTDPTVYHRQPAKRGDLGFVMTRSELMEFHRNPRRWKNGYALPDSKSLRWGSLLDCLVLTPDQFPLRYAVTPVTYPATPRKKGDPVEQKEWTLRADYCLDWEAQRIAQGQQIVSHEEYAQAKLATQALLQDHETAQVIIASKTQIMVTAAYEDRDTAIIVPCKTLIDLAPDKGHPEYGIALGDLKSTESGHPRPWTRSCFQYGYHVQGAFNLDAYNLATGEERTTFLHCVQESYPPYEVSRRFLSQEFLNLGRATYLDALRRYCRCLDSQTWPGYDEPERCKMVWQGWRLIEPEPWMVGEQP